jgi:hypothetical protein
MHLQLAAAEQVGRQGRGASSIKLLQAQ